MMTEEASEAVRRADIIFGASRMIEAFEGKTAYPYYRASDIIPVLKDKMPERAAILFSGDTGFYSGAAKLAPELKKWARESDADITVNIRPGIASFAYLAAKAGVSYQDAALVSIHGCSDDAATVSELVRSVRYGDKTFALLSGAGDVRLLGRVLSESGLGHVYIILGYQLSYPDETVGLITCEDCALVEGKGLYTALIINNQPEAKPAVPVIRDDEMIRGKVPMTKESVRHLSVLRLGLNEGSVVYDIGSGTGSVACEIARLDPTGRVYAIEMKEEACSLIAENAANLGLKNISVIQGKAPDAFRGLAKPTHAFIGGSSGNLKEILNYLASATPGIRVVINAVSLETIAEVTGVIREMAVSDLVIEQVSVSKSRELGKYHLMTAENPVLIASFNLERAER